MALTAVPTWPTSELDGDYLTELSATLKDVDVMVKRGRDVFVDATLCMFVPPY